MGLTLFVEWNAERERCHWRVLRYSAGNAQQYVSGVYFRSESAAVVDFARWLAVVEAGVRPSDYFRPKEKEPVAP